MTGNAVSLPPIPERRYARPPIVEALCELYFTGSRWDATTPGLFYEGVKANYPQKSETAKVGIAVEFRPGDATARAIQGEPRMRFAREDNSRLLQLANDLLIVNQLLPYPHYEEWREVVHQALRAYRDLADPQGVRQLGVRYINRVSVPRPGDRPSTQLEDYFHVYPRIPDELTGSHGPFMLQVLMPPICPGHRLTLTLGTSRTEDPGCFNFLLDLYDVVTPASSDPFGDIPRLLDEAHTNIVHTFEHTITEAARELFGEITDA